MRLIRKLVNLLLASLLASSLFIFSVIPVQAAGVVDIVGAEVFSSLFQPNDWLICVYYSNEWNPPYPTGVAAEYFDIELDTGGINAKIPQPDWGYKPTWIYLNPTITATLTWESAYDVNVIGKLSKYTAPPPSGTYALQVADWKGTSLIALDSWVRTTAQAMEIVYALDYYTESYGGETWPAGEGVLTPLGSDTFLKGMPGLDTIRPNLFTISGGAPGYQGKTFTQPYQGATDWEAAVGPDITDIMDTGGTLVNLSGRAIAAIISFIVYILVVGSIVSKIPEPQFAVIAALPIAFFALWAGIIDWVPVLVISSVIVVLFFAIVWLRST